MADLSKSDPSSPPDALPLAAEGAGAPPLVEADPEALDPELAMPRGEEVAAVVEALLFSAAQPLTVKRLSKLSNGVPEVEVEAALHALQARYSAASCGLALLEVAGGWQMATRPEVVDWVLRLHRHRKRNPISPSLLETLAIVAYKQPITRAEIEAIRGVDCGTPLRSLQDAGLAEIVGRKETVGRPPLYGTTDLFLRTFGLKDLQQLPTTGDLRSALQPGPGAAAPAPPGPTPAPEAPAP